MSSRNTLVPFGQRVGGRFFTTTPAPPEKRKGWHRWLYKMEPPKGGTELPDLKFLAVASVVASAGFYAWFIDPPKCKGKDKGTELDDLNKD